ncbi:Fms-interacting protein-domain-containing protein [Dissophora ornata]|nr:THO complex subunit 5 [Dissophora ornata]KAI8598140.1 Fms-interacting protein-domain-containing protein [Dissophora ornata]
MTSANVAIDHHPETVARLCNELQNLSAQIVDARKRHASHRERDDSAMDVDFGEEEEDKKVDPAFQQQLEKSVQTGNALLSLLKNINRDVYQHERELRNGLTEQKQAVGTVDLGFQNIKYQRKYLLSEISRCHDMETLYQDVPLVPLEEFKERAPEHLVNGATDEHQLMLNRLRFELEERKRFDAEKRRLLAVKVQLTKANKARKAQINKTEKQLGTYIQASHPLQGLFQEPVEPLKTHQEIMHAEAAAVASSVSAPSPTISIGEPMVISLSQDGESISEVEAEVVAPIRISTAELQKRNDVAQLLPQPLYVLFRHACAFSATFGEEVRAEIQGDIQAAQVEARVLAAAQQAASSKATQGNTVRSGTVVNVITVDSPSLQKDQMADDDEPASKDRRSSESRADTQYERFPLDVVVKIKKDALAGSHTIVHLRFGYLMRLGIVVVAVEAAPGILKLDPALILQELFPKDHGEVCPNPEAAFLGMTSYDTLISADGGVGEQGCDLVLDTNKAGGYAFRWAQEICGLEFLGPFSQGWGLATGTEHAGAMADDLPSASSTAVLSGTGNRRAFLSQAIRMIRSRRRAWKALDRQLEDLERGVIPLPKNKFSADLAGMGISYEPNNGIIMNNNSHGGAPSKVTISGWRAVADSGSKFSSVYSVQFLMPDPKLNSRAVSAKVVVAEATVEIPLAYVDRRPKWELKPGPGFPDSMKTTSSSSFSNGGSRLEDGTDMSVDESDFSSRTPLSVMEDEVKDRSPFLDSLMNTVNVELPASLYRAEPSERNMLLTLQLTRIITDLTTIMETVSN